MPFNIGIGWAVQAGLRYGLEYGYDIAAQFDADGQHRAKDLPKMLAAIEGEGTDMVIASRFLLNQGFRSTFFRRLGIRYFSFLIFILTGARITDPTSGFRMANRSLIELFSEHYAEDYPEPESTVLALKKGFYVREIPTQMQPRQTGISSITPLKALYYMVKVTLGILMANIRNNNK
jgi:glycosyltransferase involved in cell wall biosynthesis